MLLPILIDTEPLEIDISSRPKLRLHWPRDVNWRLHPQLCHAALHDGEFDGNDARHLDGAAERNLTISLAEMQIAHRELRPGYVNW